jgi:hypothetical protein
VLAARPDATLATMEAMYADGIDFLVETPVVPMGEVVRIPWSHRLTARGEVRMEVVRMYRDACAALGIEPGPSDRRV